MVAVVNAIYERGTLRLLTPLSLPERARVRVQILTDETDGDDRQRANAILEASGLVKPQAPAPENEAISLARRAELALLYATAGPLSDMIIAER